ncbi:hypothetical protein LXL04_017193 [Taraxacum kok-saghyz]
MSRLSFSKLTAEDEPYRHLPTCELRLHWHPPATPLASTGDSLSEGPKVYLLLKLALILPVATASVERAFSAMKLIKTDIRNKMGDKFLSDSLVSYIEKDVLDSFDNDTIICRIKVKTDPKH